MTGLRARAAALGAVVALAAACSGGDGLSGRERDYAEVFAADFSDGDDGFGVDEEGGTCMAEAIMRELGAEPFEDAGVEPEDLAGDEAPGELLGAGAVSEEQAETIAAAWQECADLAAALAEQAREEFGLDGAGVRCFRTALADGDVLDRYVQVSFTSDRPDEAEAVLGEIVTLVQGCTAAAEGGGILVDSIAASLADQGQLTPEQARCVAERVVQDVGAERLIEITGAGAFETAPPEVQQQYAQAIIDAATACGIAAGQLGG